MKHILKIKSVVNIARMYVSRNDTNQSRNRFPDYDSWELTTALTTRWRTMDRQIVVRLHPGGGEVLDLRVEVSRGRFETLALLNTKKFPKYVPCLGQRRKCAPS